MGRRCLGGVYADWRDRQRVEQYQDNLLMLGHSGYLETCRRAFIYCLKKHDVSYTEESVREFMKVYQGLQPFEDAVEGLRRLSGSYGLVALSNGEQWYLEKLLGNNVPITFDVIISVDQVGAFKPLAGDLSQGGAAAGVRAGGDHDGGAHSFDILGAQACGFKAAYVNRDGATDGGL